MVPHQSSCLKAPWCATTYMQCIDGQTSTDQTQKNSVQSAGRMDYCSHAGDICPLMAAHASA